MCSQDDPYLERLGIRPEVRSFFNPYLKQTCEGIIFNYGNAVEHVSDSFHRVPVTEEIWTAGEIGTASHVFICGSAMDAIAWLHLHSHAYPDQNLLFVSLGASPSKIQIESFQRPRKQYHLVFSNDQLGAICDLKVASFLRRKPVKIIADEPHFILTFKSKNYRLAHLSLNALEKAARFHFNIPVSKPKQFNTFFEQLKHGNTN